jgi:hypothetical protein
LLRRGGPNGFGLDGLAPGLADGWFLVVAGHIVPLDTVRIEVVQDAKAGLQEIGI